MISRRIEAAGGLEAVIVLRMLAAHAVPGMEVVDQPAGRYERVVEGPDGPYLIRIVIDDRGLLIASTNDDPAEQARMDLLVRRWFDLDSDLGPVNRCLSTDPLLAPLVATRPRLRVLGHPNAFEAAIGTVLGQQVSVAAARTFAGRLVAAYGMVGPGRFMRFPTPAALAMPNPRSSALLWASRVPDPGPCRRSRPPSLSAGPRFRSAGANSSPCRESAPGRRTIWPCGPVTAMPSRPEIW